MLGIGKQGEGKEEESLERKKGGRGTPIRNAQNQKKGVKDYLIKSRERSTGSRRYVGASRA